MQSRRNSKLYEPDRKPGPIREAACWVHARRPFFVMADLAENARRKAQGESPAPISPIALEGVRRIDALFEIERSINGQSAEQRRAVRQELSAPLIADLESWMREQRAKLSRGNDVAKAMEYMLKRWPAFTRFLDDGGCAMATESECIEYARECVRLAGLTDDPDIRDRLLEIARDWMAAAMGEAAPSISASENLSNAAT
jgi:hypothetical protein